MISAESLRSFAVILSNPVALLSDKVVSFLKTKSCDSSGISKVMFDGLREASQVVHLYYQKSTFHQ